MISTAEALAALFDLVKPLPSETVPLRMAAGRVLAETQIAGRNQPPFAASAMDGYAIRNSDVSPDAQLDVIGEAAAGLGYDGAVSSGQAVRIFTGAPLPGGTDRVVIQEDVIRTGDRIAFKPNLDPEHYVRPAGADFRAGDAFGAPRCLTPSDIALLAAMNIAAVPVTRQPVVAILPTGDELVQPGEVPGPDQIIASNSYGLAALIAQAGGLPRLLPIARDTEVSLRSGLERAQDADLVVTIGGASVGDHDLVGRVAGDMGLNRAFYKIAMRPGKPLMAGTLGTATLIGLPGNPVSAMVCGHIFVLPVLRKMLGLPALPAPRQSVTLAHDISANGPREHYMRARLDDGALTVFDRQDSALLSVLSAANVLAVRPPHDPARKAGETLPVIHLY